MKGKQIRFQPDIRVFDGMPYQHRNGFEGVGYDALAGSCALGLDG